MTQSVGILVRVGTAAARTAVDRHRPARTGRFAFGRYRVAMPERLRAVCRIAVSAAGTGMAGITARCAGRRDRLALITMPRCENIFGITIPAAGTGKADGPARSAGNAARRRTILMPQRRRTIPGIRIPASLTGILGLAACCASGSHNALSVLMDVFFRRNGKVERTRRCNTGACTRIDRPGKKAKLYRH